MDEVKSPEMPEVDEVVLKLSKSINAMITKAERHGFAYISTHDHGLLQIAFPSWSVIKMDEEDGGFMIRNREDDSETAEEYYKCLVNTHSLLEGWGETMTMIAMQFDQIIPHLDKRLAQGSTGKGTPQPAPHRLN